MNSSDYENHLVPEEDLKFGFAALPTEVAVLMIIFIVLFCFGISGNLGVIIFVGKTLWKLRSPVTQRPTRQLYVYLIALGIVDFLMLSMIPIMLPYLYTGQWLVGETLCRAFWTIENMNKILSIALLTAMSVERYLTVCHPLRSHFLRRKAYVYFVLLAAVGLTGILLAPILSYVELHTIQISPQLTLISCVTPMPDELFVTFIVYMFVIAFCLPALITSFCYIRLVMFVKQRYKRRRQAGGFV